MQTKTIEEQIFDATQLEPTYNKRIDRLTDIIIYAMSLRREIIALQREAKSLNLQECGPC